MKKFIIKIGYQHYAMDQEDALQALGILGRMVQVSRAGYSGPFYPTPHGVALAAEVQMAEFVNERPAQEERPAPRPLEYADDLESPASGPLP